MLRLDLNPSPRTASSPSSSDGRAKRSNPLVDLIETEKIYVDQLSGIIRVRCSLARPFLMPLLIVDTEGRLSMVAHKPPSP
jgi:ABC-type nitrate/sulfonate/bicarbonate transport system ATPase subunit